MSGMNALDIGLVVLIAAIGGVGLVRGFGRTLLDTLALYAALWAATLAAPQLAARVSFQAGGAGLNESWALGLLLLILSGLLVAVAWYVYGMTQFDAGMFDKLLGLAAGLTAGAIVAHSVVAVLVMADPSCRHSAAQVASGTVGSELYSFSNYHAVVDTITGSKTYMREAPNPASMAGR